jgi:catechol 2,3-dioxygenase-like lactoylglutathione lyase family enzyme
MSAEITAVHPVLMARDVGESSAFYVLLGFAEVFRDALEAPRYAVVRRGPVELHLQWADPSQWAHAGDRPAYRFPTPAVDALYDEALAAGALSQQTGGPYAVPNDTPWGTREFHVRDPGANVLQFYGPLPFARADAG